MHMHLLRTDEGEPDGTSRWFDRDAATVYEEDSYQQAGKRISCATGCHLHHQELVRTRKGTWVLGAWENGSGRDVAYCEVTPGEAAIWLIANNGHLPEELMEFLAQLEV